MLAKLHAAIFFEAVSFLVVSFICSIFTRISLNWVRRNITPDWIYNVQFCVTCFWYLFRVSVIRESSYQMVIFNFGSRRELFSCKQYDLMSRCWFANNSRCTPKTLPLEEDCMNVCRDISLLLSIFIWKLEFFKFAHAHAEITCTVNLVWNNTAQSLFRTYLVHARILRWEPFGCKWYEFMSWS